MEFLSQAEEGENGKREMANVCAGIFFLQKN
jgi:hypothetical protein